MKRFADLRLSPQALARYGLPDIGYPVPVGALGTAASRDGELRRAMMLEGLQQRSREGAADWRMFEGAMQRLAELLAPDDERQVVTAIGEDWWLEIGPVDLRGEVVTVQRGELLIAAIAARADGRLRVAAFRPLDAKSAEYLVGLARVPHPEHGVCLRENNWEYALDCSAGMGNVYAAQGGEAYLSYWERGIGISRDGTEVSEWRPQQNLVARRPALVATELGVHYALSGAGGREQQDTHEPGRPGRLPWRSRRQQRRTVQGRFLGCLLGGAAGDALGAPVEFLSRKEILTRFGPRGITTYAPAYGGIGTITDDTQMTLFTAEGLIRGWVRGRLKGITSYPSVTASAYLRWLRTQGERPSGEGLSAMEQVGWLFQQRPLHSRRGPGNTCLSALRSMQAPGEPARNDSKGCGGVMRMAPVGLFAWRLQDQLSAQDAFRLGTQLAALTHGHPTGSLAAGVLSVLVMALTDGASLPEALAAGRVCLRQEPMHEETLRALDLAEELAATDVPHVQAIARLGRGWVAEEALAIAVYCALVARTFRHGVLLAVNHDGDSDSTGSITGNLLGALHGVRSIPGGWLEPLELRSVITELAEDLYAFRDWDLGEHSETQGLRQQVWEKYPGV